MFLLPAGASGSPRIPTASVTPIIYGTQGANGWYVTNVTINWVIEPLGYTESDGCDAHTVAADTVGTRFTCHVTWCEHRHHSERHDSARRDTADGDRRPCPGTRRERLVQPRR